MDKGRVALIVAGLMLAWGVLTWAAIVLVRLYWRTAVWLDGKKTYLVGAAYIAHAVLGWLIGDVDARHATDRVLEGLGAMTMRAGVNKVPAAISPPPASLPPPQPPQDAKA